MLKGNHLIAGEWVGSDATFANEPVSGTPDSFAAGTPDHVARAVQAGEEAFWSYGWSTRAERAAFLRRIADEIESRGAAITAQGQKETGLPAARLEGERGRTTGQLRLFADHIEKGDYLDRRHDPALPDRQPLPRPDLRLMQRPVGPVAVFGASNFPLAFSTAGGDTASALAAGCPVVVKGHPAHPGVSDLVAQAIDAARRVCGLHPGVFSQILGQSHGVGQALVQHPLIRAVGFTGSLAGGGRFSIYARRGPSRSRSSASWGRSTPSSFSTMRWPVAAARSPKAGPPRSRWARGSSAQIPASSCCARGRRQRPLWRPLEPRWRRSECRRC
ncbi:NADP-dependent aldehyde dehydrogenase [Jhaorihella thermophila]|uniref:NADP-dependent aldehyde dehydrogenase n=1 Tax=Jhaorihella thermophila TaxID=488547 RepID=A0A1H5UHD4_9RHOB|nr:NADP-dependent aldehyde dehydrogenase [Jhaorihella thermophila]